HRHRLGRALGSAGVAHARVDLAAARHLRAARVGAMVLVETASERVELLLRFLAALLVAGVLASVIAARAALDARQRLVARVAAPRRATCVAATGVAAAGRAVVGGAVMVARAAVVARALHGAACDARKRHQREAQGSHMDASFTTAGAGVPWCGIG